MSADQRKQMIFDVLALDQDAQVNEDNIVKRSLWLWQRIANELVPLIGETGFQSLYSRAVHLSLPHCKNFSLSKQNSSTEGVFIQLRLDLIALENDIARQCSTVLLTKFTDLVATMIGDVLMNQILRSAWQDQSSTPEL